MAVLASRPIMRCFVFIVYIFANAKVMIIFSSSVSFAVEYTFLLFRWSVAELLFKNPRKVRQVFEAHFKTDVGYFFALVVDFIVRRLEPSVYFRIKSYQFRMAEKCFPTKLKATKTFLPKRSSKSTKLAFILSVAE
jgi:hypothetical protein